MADWKYRSFIISFDFLNESLLLNLFSGVRSLRGIADRGDFDNESLCSAVSAFFNAVFGENTSFELFSSDDPALVYIDAYKSFTEFISGLCCDAVENISKSENKYLHQLEGCG